MFGGFRSDGTACADAWLLNTDADQDKPALTPTPPLTFRSIPHRALVPLGGRGGAAAAVVGGGGGPSALVVMGGGVASSGRMIGAGPGVIAVTICDTCGGPLIPEPRRWCKHCTVTSKEGFCDDGVKEKS